MKIVKIENSERYQVVSNNSVVFNNAFGYGFKSQYKAYLGMIGAFKNKRK